MVGVIVKLMEELPTHHGLQKVREKLLSQNFQIPAPLVWRPFAKCVDVERFKDSFFFFALSCRCFVIYCCNAMRRWSYELLLMTTMHTGDIL